MLSCLVLTIYRFFNFRKALGTDNVFHPTGVGLRCLGVNACGDKLLCKETVALIDGFGNFPAYISQVEKIIFIHREKAAVIISEHVKDC